MEGHPELNYLEAKLKQQTDTFYRIAHIFLFVVIINNIRVKIELGSTHRYYPQKVDETEKIIITANNSSISSGNSNLT